MTAVGERDPGPPPFTGSGDLLAYCYAMESEAAERYADLAQQMETHNNLKTAETFRRLAGVERKHVEHVLERLGGKVPPPIPLAWRRFEDPEAPETAPAEAAHYMMTPYHALQMALASEQRGERFFRDLAKSSAHAEVRRLAAELAEVERGHVAMVQELLKTCPPPDANWADDWDPPVMPY